MKLFSFEEGYFLSKNSSSHIVSEIAAEVPTKHRMLISYSKICVAANQTANSHCGECGAGSLRELRI